jgi:short-chain Z-isoprenyl diphosphate synthase
MPSPNEPGAAKPSRVTATEGGSAVTSPPYPIPLPGPGATLAGLWAGAARLIARPLYRLYERRLLREVCEHPVPRHIGIILDGNRRYGERHGVHDPRAIYALGAGKLDDILDWCAALAVPAVTLWVFSTDNLKRPTEQVSGLLSAIEAKLRSLAHHPQIHHRRVRVRAIGKLDLLPPTLVAAIQAAGEATASYEGMVLTIAVAYGGREEIVDAVQALLAEQAEQGLTLSDAIPGITAAGIGRHVYMAGSPDPDLIIRTSGEIRLSGFLLWQSAHSEFYFCDVPWPALRKVDFLRAVRAYQHRTRRFGR